MVVSLMKDQVEIATNLLLDNLDERAEQKMKEKQSFLLGKIDALNSYKSFVMNNWSATYGYNTLYVFLGEIRVDIYNLARKCAVN